MWRARAIASFFVSFVIVLVLLLDRNTDLQSVRPAGLQPAEFSTADQISAGRTGNMPVFRDAAQLRRLKKLGFSDRQLAIARGVSESEIRAERKTAGVIPTYRLVDTCAAEFEAFTPYYYSTYGTENEMRDRKSVV